jgi:hypothetical protein
VAKCWGEALYFIYTPPPLVSGRMTNCDKRGGPFVAVGYTTRD